MRPTFQSTHLPEISFTNLDINRKGKSFFFEAFTYYDFRFYYSFSLGQNMAGEHLREGINLINYPLNEEEFFQFVTELNNTVKNPPRKNEQEFEIGMKPEKGQYLEECLPIWSSN